MNEQTERLREEMQRILLQYMGAIHAELIHSHDDVFLSNKILQACKESGLKFVDVTIDDSTQYNDPINASRLEIKEIEL